MLRPLQLPDHFSGKLWLTSMPGRIETLDEFLGWCREVSVDEIVCLVGGVEIADKSPHYGDALRLGTFPIPVEYFPIPDFGIPTDITGSVDLVCRMVARLKLGRKIVLHCAGGHGRTGMVATMVLIAGGDSMESALNTVEMAGSAPDTDKQKVFIKMVAPRLAGC